MPIKLSHIRKTYGSHIVFHDLSLLINDGDAICLMAPSGSGKTTLLRLLMGLEQPDSGTIEGVGTVSAQFQEDRLLEDFTPLDNLRLVLGAKPTADLEQLLLPLLPSACFHQPARELSGGMRRRLALIRALSVPSQLLILDEPFTGLDAVSRADAIAHIHRHRQGRTLIVATHRIEDADELNGQILTIEQLDCKT